jgi:hypothetical protein
MSSKELRRKTVMDEVAGGRRTLRLAAEVQISYRQCRRVYQRYRGQGDPGLIHRNRGRESNWKIRVERRRQILARYQQRYAGYGPTFASEKLADDGLGLDHETLIRAPDLQMLRFWRYLRIEQSVSYWAVSEESGSNPTLSASCSNSFP